MRHRGGDSTPRGIESAGAIQLKAAP